MVLSAHSDASPTAPAVVGQFAATDTFVRNLERRISDRGEPFPDPVKPFGRALDTLTLLDGGGPRPPLRVGAGLPDR